MGNKQGKSKRPKSLKKDVIDDSELKAIFKEFDTDGDGWISQPELQKALKRLGLYPTSLEINAMFSAADINRDGKITFDEFKDLIDRTPAFSSLTSAFKQFDLDGDGGITKEELKKVVRRLGQAMTEAEMDDMFDAADANGDGKINFEEFANMMKCRPLVLNLQDVFKQFDVDGDGYISESELRVVCKQLSVPANEKEVKAMFQAADINNDGRISFEEFSSLLTKRNQ